MALSQAVVEEGVRKAASYISTKHEDKASKAVTFARIEIAVGRMDIVLEKTGKKAITCASLLRSWNVLKRVYMEGIQLLNKNKPQQELDGQVVVRKSSYFHQFANRAASLSISTLVGLGKEHLSPSDAEKFERYADWAEKFVAEVESSCPLQYGTFRFPFVRHLFEGKTVWYIERKGRKHFCFFIWPVILEGRGVEAFLAYKSFDPDKPDKGFLLWLMLRISESTDIVGAAINCLRSSASLLDTVAQDAAGQLTLLHNFQDVSYSYDPPGGYGIHDSYTSWTQCFRSDALCCQANIGYQTNVKTITSSELSHIFPEHTICFSFQCGVPALEYRMPSTSDQDCRNAVIDRCWEQHVVLTYGFAPHHDLPPCSEHNCSISAMISNKKEYIHCSIHGSIQETVEKNRANAINFFIDKPEVTSLEMLWFLQHGCVIFEAEKPSPEIATAPQASGRYKTRSASKRKR